MTTRTPAEWNERYRTGDTPWEIDRPSPELIRVLDAGFVPPGRAIEFGCGTGANAVFLAQRGFEVTAVDCAPAALETARRRAAEAHVEVHFLEGDVCRLPTENLGTFDFVFDRGCYHCVRRFCLDEFFAMLETITRPGSRALCLAGNAKERSENGPPRVTDEELRREWGRLFDIHALREFRFEDASGTSGPLSWSASMVRHGDA